MSVGTNESAKERRMQADLRRYPLDPFGYPERVRELEAEGLTTSDAQGCADVEYGIGATDATRANGPQRG